MRHGDKINNLGRTASHRKALLRNLAIALIEHKRITTTVAKAKSLRRFVEPILTKAKDNTTHSRRVVFGYLQNKEALKELYGPIAARIGERPGGYVRVIKLGFRRGDGAETAMIELVDYNEVYNPNAGKVKTTKKTRRGTKKQGAETLGVAETATAAIIADDVVDAVETPLGFAEDIAEETVMSAEAAAEQVVEDAAPAQDAAPDAPAVDDVKPVE